MPRYIDAEPIEQFIANGLNRTPKEEAMGFDAIEILSEIHFAPTADVMPRTKQAAIDYLEEIGWMEEHDREITAATRNFVGLQY